MGADQAGGDRLAVGRRADSIAVADSILRQRELLGRLRDGDDDAYERVVREFGPPLLAVARRLLSVEQDAQDAVQDAFLSAFRKIDDFQGQSQLATWLHRITVNACLMKLRKQRRRKELSIEELLSRSAMSQSGGPSPAWSITYDDAVENNDLKRIVREHIDQLPQPYREVLLLRDIEQLTTEEAADVLEISPGAVKTRLHRARQALKLLLDPEIVELTA
ncbi:MAG: sigma-70 family RNA polymerase sigma factor [Planctomycetales bacterium]|nr:sigma-70 family RNA polymerase sigma factor [Planctomycetales bacterium]